MPLRWRLPFEARPGPPAGRLGSGSTSSFRAVTLGKSELVETLRVSFSGNAPRCLLHNLKHNEVLHEHVVLLSIEVPDIPFVSPEGRSQVTHLGKGVHRVVLRYGFMEQPDVPSDLAVLEDKGIPFDPMRTSYFVGRNSFVSANKPLLPRWQQKLFLTLSRFAASAGDFFGLPANRVVELGSRIEI